MSDISASAEAKEKSTGKKKSSGDPSLNMDELRDLAALVDEHGFTDFEFENENIRVRLGKMTAPQFFPAAPQSYPPMSAPPTAAAAPVASNPAPTAASETDIELFKITSPIVGTFYQSPAPDKDAYVKIGDSVSPETIVCIVEAMKLMNEIQAETSGEIVKIYVENGQPVEYGQPLYGIKK
ncbi:MAG: acetyl-CoA carboxylase biotin carboxyl carrier protein [Acidobacteria bacterium]|nr:acetyl-CoA carboxylase biotin carboxyl carrier protein [Acidobacteriota bacterium]